MIEFVIGFFIAFFSFMAGAALRDHQAARVEKDLRSRIEALKLVNQSNRQELLSMHRNNGAGVAVRKMLEQAGDYSAKIEAGYPGTNDWHFNRGVRHGLNSAVIFLRGWL